MHTCPTLHGPRQSVKRGVNKRAWEGGEQVRRERAASLPFSLLFIAMRREARCVDRIRSRFGKRKDSQRERCLPHRAYYPLPVHLVFL